MFVARVTGVVVATQKVASMTGHKLLTVEPLRVDPQQRDRLIGTGRTFVVVDALGGRSTSLFDAAGNMTGQLDQRGDLTQFLFDADEPGTQRAKASRQRPPHQ